MTRHMSIGNRHGVVLKRKIFVGGINPALGNDILRKYFSTFGPVEDATIMRYSDGRSRGFGFVVFLNEATCAQVLQQRTHPVTPHDKVEVKPCLSRSKTRVIGGPGIGPTGSAMGGPTGGYDGYPAHHSVEGFKGMYRHYRGGGASRAYTNVGPSTPYRRYDSNEYSRCGYGDSRGTCPPESGAAVGGSYSHTNCTTLPSDYMGYTSNNVAPGVLAPYGNHLWMNGYRENNSKCEYWKDPYDQSYAASEYYGEEGANVSVNPPTSLATVPLSRTAGQRTGGGSYPTMSQAPSSVISDASQSTRSSSAWINSEGYFDMGSLAANDPRAAYGASNPVTNGPPRHTSCKSGAPNVSAPPTSVASPLHINSMNQLGDDHPTGYASMRRDAQPNYGMSGSVGFQVLNGFQRNVPY